MTYLGRPHRFERRTISISPFWPPCFSRSISILIEVVTFEASKRSSHESKSSFHMIFVGDAARLLLLCILSTHSVHAAVQLPLDAPYIQFHQSLPKGLQLIAYASNSQFNGT